MPDSYANAAIGPALDRLTGILIGMTVLEPVLIGWHVIAPARVTGGNPKTGGMDGE